MISASPTPADDLREALAPHMKRHPDRWARTVPSAIPPCSPAHIQFLVEDAKADIAFLLATIADLRRQVAEAEARNDKWLRVLAVDDDLWEQVTKRLMNAEAERDALAGMAGWLAGRRAQSEDARLGDLARGDEIGALYERADARALEAVARAERYAALLHPLAVYAAVALPPEGLDGEIGEVIVGAFRRSIRTTDLRAILLEFPQPEESADARF